MGQFDLRRPQVGDSLRRDPDPHLIPPEQLDLQHPLASTARRPRIDVADIMRAHDYFTETPEPRRGSPLTPPPPIVRLDGAGHAGGTPAAPTGGLEGSAEIGGPRARVRIDGDIEGNRNAAGESHASGSVGGSIRLERPDAALEAEAHARELGTADAAGRGDVRIRLGQERAGVRIDGGVAGVGTDHTTGHAGARVNVGRATERNVEVGASATSLGTNTPRVTGTAAISAGARGPRLEVEGGVTPGRRTTGHVAGAFSVGSPTGTQLRVSGSAQGLGGPRQTGEADAELRTRVNRALQLHVNGGASGLGGPDPSGHVGAGVEVQVGGHTSVTLDGGASGLGTDNPEAHVHTGLRVNY
jgi:hypothetical protein